MREGGRRELRGRELRGRELRGRELRGRELKARRRPNSFLRLGDFCLMGISIWGHFFQSRE
jgi:hypothetical protein